MALVKAEDIGNQINGISNLPLFRQIGLMVALAATVALAVAIVLWVKEPSYRMLYGNLSDQEMLEITTALDQAGIRYDINSSTNAVMVDAARVHDARMKLAGVGLPKGSGTGYELLDKDQGFGTSQLIETARYQRAIEGELARTIATLNNVQSARVHLAIPKQSAFVRDRKHTSGSVMLNLYQGRKLSSEQASAIAHLVASSVPNLEVEDVTVVDQNGRLMTQPEMASEMAKSSTQFEYRQTLEAYYIKRIEALLEPIVGFGKVKAQVSADLDFTQSEETHESFNPDPPAIRSEQVVEESSNSGALQGGVPGTLSNQPPAGGTIGANGANNTAGAENTNNSRRTIRNYELDRTVSHTKQPTGNIRRLSAAVVVDNKVVDGESAPLTEEELTRINGLVKEAIGFDEGRGDTVNVINAPFQSEVESTEPPETSFLDQPWVWDTLKQLAGLGIVLFLIFGVLRPALKSLAEKGAVSRPANQGDAEMALLEGGQAAALTGPSYERALESAKQVAQQEPQRVARVVKEWVEKDGG